MPRFGHDIRFAARALWKSPALTLVAVVSLALGIGAVTTVFTVINALFLRTLAVREPRELVGIWTTRPDGKEYKEPLSWAMFRELGRNQEVFSAMFGTTGERMATLEANGAMYPGLETQVTGEYFSTLGVQPLLGRLITPEDAPAHAGASARVAVLDYRCWRQRYHGDAGVVGKTIRIDGMPFTVIGVTPRSFGGQLLDVASDVITPLRSSGRTAFRERSVLFLFVTGRLKAEVTVEQARERLKALWPGIRAAVAPSEYQGSQREEFLARRIDVDPAATGRSYLRARLSRPLAILMGLAALVLVIACVNLANLMMVRAAGRRQELAIRIALGAGGWRLVSLLVAESVMLSLAGAALGLMVSGWASRVLLRTLWTGYVPLTLDPAPDLGVFAFTAALALSTGVLFGLGPGFRALGVDAAGALAHNNRTVRGGHGIPGRLLVSGQVALSLVLVLGATLLVGTLRKLRSFDPGFRRQGVLMIQLFPQPGRDRKIPNRVAYFRELAEKMLQLPGVESVSYAHLGPAARYEFQEPVSAGTSGAPVRAVTELVGPGFFHLMGMRVLTGREFGWSDEHSPPVAILSESLARRLFPGGDPIGRRVLAGAGSGTEHGGHRERQVVGVVSNASLWNLRSREPMAVYLPLMQEPLYNTPLLNIRTAGDPSAAAPAARKILESLGHQYPLRIQTVEERTDMLLADERVIAMLSASLGVLALLLASVGLYGVLSYSITRRTAELGIRMALGAQRGHVLRLVLGEALILVLAGVAVGIPAAWAAARMLAGMLFGLAANDPATMAWSVAVLLGVALIAGYLPARRASRIDPMAALRCQ